MGFKIYMVEFTVPALPEEEFFNLIPEHRAKVNEMMLNEIIITYSLAFDRSKIWAQFKASEESELVHYIEMLPLTKYLDYQYTELMFMEVLPMKMNFSLN